MLPTILLDPSIFWLVDATDKVGDFVDWLERSIAWLKNEQLAELRIAVPLSQIDRLVELNRWPLEPMLRSLLAQNQLEEVIGSGELAAVLNRALSMYPSFDDVLVVKELLIDGISIDKDITEAITDDELRDLSRESIAIAGVNEALSPGAFFYAFPRAPDAIKAVDVAIKVAAVDPPEFEAALGELVDATLKVVNSPVDVCRQVSALDIWRASENDRELRFSLIAGAAVIAQSSLRKFSIGPNFLESLGRNACKSSFASICFAKCSSLVSDADEIDSDYFRETGAQWSAPPEAQIGWSTCETFSPDRIRCGPPAYVLGVGRWVD